MEAVTLFLTLLFLILVFSVCGKKAFRLLLSLALTLFAFIYIITPLIVNGYDPITVIVLIGLPLLACIVYLTEGFSPLSHLAIIGTGLNFLLISILIHVSVSTAGLTGLVSGDASFLGLAGINIQKLLIAGMMLGTLGILTEMVVTQIATVIEFIKANPNADSKQIYQQCYKVGIAHLGSIINTLFLVYTGISFPLLIIYIGGNASLGSALNYEPIVSEVIRMLDGTIGLIISMPTSTLLAVWWLKYRLENKSKK